MEHVGEQTESKEDGSEEESGLQEVEKGVINNQSKDQLKDQSKEQLNSLNNLNTH